MDAPSGEATVPPMDGEGLRAASGGSLERTPSRSRGAFEVPVDLPLTEETKPPMRLAIPLDAGPSSVVTTPTTSRSPWGVMCTTLSTDGSTWLIDVSAASETILPNTSSPVATMNPIGWIGAVVPGGSTGRWTPR